MGTLIRVFCILMLLWVTAGRAVAQFEQVIDALPADRLFVASITASIAGYETMTNIEKARALRLKCRAASFMWG